MPTRANIARSYTIRFALLTLFCLGAAGWFLYDGTVAWPRQRQRALAYERLPEDERISKWHEVARQNGWPLANPGKPKTDAQIFAQKVIALVVALAALPFAFVVYRLRGRWIELEDAGLRTSWGQRLEFSQIMSLDKKKWKAKGIAAIHYDRDGRQCRLVLDDWKYDTDATVDILRAVEANIEPAKIQGGPPEAPPKADSGEADSTAADDAN